MRIGYDKIIPINIHIICASNKDLKSLMNEGTFRKHLYYRLCVLPLRLPSLREREQDILLLANHYISRYASTFSKNRIQLSPDTQKLFLNYSWDGNIKELHSICEQLVALNETGIISTQEVSNVIPIGADNQREGHSNLNLHLSNDISREKKQFEKNLLIKALKECNYNKTKAASLLDMNRITLWKKLKEYNIECKTIL